MTDADQRRAPPAAGLTLSEAMQQALTLHRAGDLQQAERLYAAILDVRPNHFDALHLSGVIALQRGRHGDAVTLIDRALSVTPDAVEALRHRGQALGGLGRVVEAVATFDRLLAIDPGHANAWAERGHALADLHKLDQAVASYDRALALAPQHLDALTGRARALTLLDRRDQAVETYARYLALRPDDADILNNRGEALRVLRRYDEALADFDRALALKPGAYQTLNNRGATLFALRRNRDALEAYEQALAVKPDFPEALNNRGNVLAQLNRQDEALADYDRALALRPDYARAWGNRAIALLKLGQPAQSVESFRRSLDLARSAEVHSNFIFALNFDASAGPEDHQAERARWNALYAQSLSSALPPHANVRDPERKLRVGYVSGHFRSQAAIYAFGGVLLGHDPERFEVVCFSDTDEEDDVTERVRARAGAWHRTVGLPDDALADLIRAQQIDILVDCVGHMSGHRLLTFARKPAPVQVTAWGEPTGTGLTTMDYLFADPVLVPRIQRGMLAERVIDLPNFLGYWVPAPLPDVAAPPMLTGGHVTFGSFNRLAKLQEPVLRTWAAILRALPDSRLVLKGEHRRVDRAYKAGLDRLMAEEGIAPERITLLGQLDRDAFFAAYNGVDIALDPFPHGGGMTTLDALSMGVPVVTMPGRTISSRLAAASLTALGLTDFIAPDRAAYIDLAVAKASDPQALAELRAGLRARVATSAFGDAARYTAAVEAAYRAIWRAWCAR